MCEKRRCRRITTQSQTAGRRQRRGRRRQRRCRCDALLRAPLPVQFRAECPQGARNRKPYVRKPKEGRAKSNGGILCDCGCGRPASMCTRKGGHLLCTHRVRKDQCTTPPCDSGYKHKPPMKCAKCNRVGWYCKKKGDCDAYCSKKGITHGQ